jgi:hypothetical protein
VKSSTVSVTAETFVRLKKYVTGKPEYRGKQLRGRQTYVATKLVDKIINDALDKAGAK